MINNRLRSFIISLLCCFAFAPVFSSDSMEELAENEWDVTEPKGVMKTISIDTTETTWSNLSVSKDGKTLVFDMLGEYTPCPLVAAKLTHWCKGLIGICSPPIAQMGKA